MAVIRDKEKLSKSTPIYEGAIKRDLIDYLLVEHGRDEISLATEVPFCGYRRRADLIFVNGHSYAFEIKSSQDSLAKLSYQIDDYRQVFDYVYAVVDQAHLQNVRQHLPDGVGLMSYVEGEFTRVRTPKINKRKSKYMLSCFIERQHMVKMLCARDIKISAKSSIHQIRMALTENFSIPVLNQAATSSIKERYRRGTTEFLDYKGISTAIDDIIMLGTAQAKDLRLFNS